MKFLRTLSVVSAIALLAGCGSEKEPAKAKGPGGQDEAKVVETSKTVQETKFKSYCPTPYDQITSHLDPGGDYYMVMSGGKVVDRLGEMFGSYVDVFKEMAKTFPVSPAKKNPIETIEAVTKIIKNIGFGDLDGIGISSVALQKEMYRIKTVYTHKSAQGEGLIWNMSGAENGDLPLLKMAPENTVLFSTGSCDLNYFYKWLEEQCKLSGVPELAGGFDPFIEVLKMQTKVDIKELIQSTASEMAFFLTMDPAKKISVNDPRMQLNLAKTNLAITFRVKNHKIFDTLNKMMPPAMPRKEVNGRSAIMIPVPPQKELSGVTIFPTITKYRDLLIFSLNEEIIEEMMAAESSGKSLSSTAKFQSFANGIEVKGISCDYMDERFMNEFGRVYGQILNQAAKEDQQLGQDHETLIDFFEKQFSNKARLAVAKKVEKGVVFEVNSQVDAITEGGASIAALPLAYLGIASAIAIPTISKIDSTIDRAHDVKRETNINMVRLAKERFQLDTGVTDGSLVKFSDIECYLPTVNTLKDLEVDGVPINIGQIGEEPSY